MGFEGWGLRHLSYFLAGVLRFSSVPSANHQMKALISKHVAINVTWSKKEHIFADRGGQCSYLYFWAVLLYVVKRTVNDSVLLPCLAWQEIIMSGGDWLSMQNPSDTQNPFYFCDYSCSAYKCCLYNPFLGHWKEILFCYAPAIIVNLWACK